MIFERRVYDFLEELELFDYDLSGTDRVWNMLFPDTAGKWYYVQVVQYRETFYVHLHDGCLCSLEVIPGSGVSLLRSSGISSREDRCNDPVSRWELILASGGIWIKKVRKNWIRANSEVWREYPINRRTGVVAHSIVRVSMPGLYRLDLELGRTKTEEFLSLVESGYFNCDKNLIVSSMTA